MGRIRGVRAKSYVAYFLIFLLVIPLGLVRAPRAAAQEAQEALRTIAVLPFADVTKNHSRALGEIAADAVVLPLVDSGEYEVIAKDDVERERDALGLRRDLEPLNVSQLVRLGKRLGIQGIMTGKVLRYEVALRHKQGAEAWARVNIALFDVNFEELLDGATADAHVGPFPGYRGTGDELGGEALRAAAEDAVQKMLASRLPIGKILARDIHGEIRINLGAEDAVNAGDRFIVTRPDYIPGHHKLVQRKISELEVFETESRLSHAHERGRQCQMGDRVVRIYKPVYDLESVRKERRKSKALIWAIGGVLLLATINLALGPTGRSAPTGATAYLAQTAPGAPPVIRLHIPRGAIPDASHIWVYVVHRSLIPQGGQYGAAWFNPTAETAIDVEENPRIEYYDDDAVDRVIEVDLTRRFITPGTGGGGGGGGGGTEETFAITGTINHRALQDGVTYFYRLQRVTDPNFLPGENPPEGTTGTQGVASRGFGRTPGKGLAGISGLGEALFGRQAVPVVFAPATLTADRQDVMSEPSRPIGPVTYLQPPLQLAPDDEDKNQTTTNIRFTWYPSPGANEYRVDIFPANDPGTLGNPIFMSPPIVSNATGNKVIPFALQGVNLERGKRFYWRIGARKRDELSPICDALPNAKGYLWSTIRWFETAISPPGTP